MVSIRSAKASKHSFKEPDKPKFPSVDAAQLALWIDAVADYARALNKMGWFAAPADEREGRLFLEKIPDATPELIQAQMDIHKLLLKSSNEQPNLIEILESCIKLSFPAWKKILNPLKTQKLDVLTTVSPPEIKSEIYFYQGRYIVDTFCDPIKKSEKWSLFLNELSQAIHDHLSSQIPEKELKKLVQQQVDALEAVILDAAAYCLLKTWNDLYVPKAEEGTPEGHISREKQRILNVLLHPLTATFNESPAFLLNLFLEYKNKKVNMPLLALRMGITTEIDDRLIIYVHKTEDVRHIQQYKEKLQEELEEKLKEKLKDQETIPSDAEVEYHHSSIPAPPPSTRPRAATMPAVLGVNPSLLLKSTLYRQRQASMSDKEEPSAALSLINPANQ
jgi:hypothetical protein